jgi:hypothetical protein
VPVRTSRKSYCGSIALRSCLLSECALKVFSCRNPSKLNTALRYQTAGRALPVHCISNPKRPGASFEEGSRQRCVSDVTARPRRSCSGGDHAAMTIVRSEHRAQFTIVPNAILRDELGL